MKKIYNRSLSNVDHAMEGEAEVKLGLVDRGRLFQPPIRPAVLRPVRVGIFR